MLKHTLKLLALLMLLLLAQPAAVQAQYNYITNNGAITITQYTGPGGNVIIPSTTNGLPVTRIGDSAFHNGTNNNTLTSITIPNSITDIGNYAFYGCQSLKSLTIPDSVTNIGNSAFVYCYSLPSVTIPNSVISIGSTAFSSCSSLTNVTIPDSVTSIGAFAFISCTKLTAITVDALNPYYSSVAGVLFNKSQTALIQYATGLAGDYAILNSVTNIKNHAFSSSYGLTSIMIPGSVINIGNNAFSSCSSLTNVAIPNRVISIGTYAFDSCGNLTNVTIPDSVTNIGFGALFSCTKLTAITVDALNPAYSSVAGVLFNKSQTALIQYTTGISGSYAISNSVTSISKSAFSSSYNLTSVTIPNSVTNIGDSAFSSCSSLTNATLPNSVTSIGSATFIYCTSLTNLTIPNGVTSIGDSAFYNCSSLNNITLSGSLTSIGNNTFYDCFRLTSVTFPNSLASIGNDAFYFCTSLTSVTIPNSVTSIGDGAFASCTSLSAITVGVPNTSYSSVNGVLFNKNQTTLIQCPGGESGSYIVPNSVTSIGNYAFSYCTSLTNLTIPGNVTTLGYETFYYCSSLKSVYFQSNAPSVYNSFGGNNIATVYYLAGTTSWGATFDGRPAVMIFQDYLCVVDNGMITITGYTGTGGVVTIPSTITGLPVTSIGNSAFASSASLTSVTIPNSVTSIGNSAFASCTSLTGVYFLGNAPSLGSSIFFGAANSTVNYLAGTEGWSSTFGGRPTAVWIPTVPTLLNQPLTQTVEIGSASGLSVDAVCLPLPIYQWFFNGNIPVGSLTTNSTLKLPNVQPNQAGTYSVVIANGNGSVTSAPAMLSVIPFVAQRMIPAIALTAESGSFLHLEFTGSLALPPTWQVLNTVTLTGTSGTYFDLTSTLPAQRFYRAWQSGTPSMSSSLNLNVIPAVTLTGTVGSSVRVDSIPPIGATNAWLTLGTVTLTNNPQLYFDVSPSGQTKRLYRLVQVP